MLRSWMCPPDLQPEGADPPAGTGAWRQTVQVRAVDGFRHFSEGSFLPGPSLIRIIVRMCCLPGVLNILIGFLPGPALRSACFLELLRIWGVGIPQIGASSARGRMEQACLYRCPGVVWACIKPPSSIVCQGSRDNGKLFLPCLTKKSPAVRHIANVQTRPKQP